MALALDALVLFVFPWLVLLAATSDMFTMTIPNRVTLALIAGFAIAAPLAGLGLTEIGWHVAAGVLVLLITFGMFIMGWMGGGDAKLAAGVALWLGWDLTLEFAMLSAMIGGPLTLLLVVLREQNLPGFMYRYDWSRRLLHRETGIPYGIAISAGAMIVYTSSPWITQTI